MKPRHLLALFLTGAFLASPTLAQVTPRTTTQPRQTQPTTKPHRPDRSQPRNNPNPNAPTSPTPTDDTPGDTPDVDARKADLSPKFRKGEVIKFRMEMDSVAKVSMPALDDKPEDRGTNHDLGLTFKVKDVSDDGATIELSFSRVKMTQHVGTEKDEFDSNQPIAKDKGSEIAPQLRELAKTVFTLYLDKTGNISRVDGGSGLGNFGALGGKQATLPGMPTGNSGPCKAFEDAIGSIFSIKRGNPKVSVGESWTNADTVDSGMLGNFKIEDKHKLKSYNGTEAFITYTGHIEPASGGGDAISLFKIKDSSFFGDYTWNTREGMLRKMDLTQHVSVDGGSGISMIADSKAKVTRTN